MRARLVLTALALTAIGAVALQFTAGRGGAAVGAAAAPVAVGVDGNEPIVKVAPDGTLYISALEYLYLSRDSGRTWFKAQPTIYNGPCCDQGVNLNTDSSIDVDPAGRLYMTFDWPYAGATAVCLSDDQAQHFNCNNHVLPGGTDRMWLVAPTSSTSYLTTNEGLYHTLFFQSSDRGADYTPTKSTD